jgi:hypothetical protein
LASKKVTVGLFDETRNYINDFLFINTYSKIPEFQIAKENSSEFLFSRYLSQLHTPSSKISKDVERQSRMPSMIEVTPNNAGFVTSESDLSLSSPYRTSIQQVPSPLTAHGSFTSERRPSTGENLRSLYPIGKRSNRPTVHVKSIIIEREENSPSGEYVAQKKNARPSTKREVPKTTVVTSSHVMDDKSFTAVDIDNVQVQNIESLIKKYQTASYATSSPDSLKLPGIKSSQTASFVSPTLSPDSVKFSGNYSRFFESSEVNRLSVETSTDLESNDEDLSNSELSSMRYSGMPPQGHSPTLKTASSFSKEASTEISSPIGKDLSKRYSGMPLDHTPTLKTASSISKEASTEISSPIGKDLSKRYSGMPLDHTPTLKTASSISKEASTEISSPIGKDLINQNRHFFVIEEEDSLNEE